METRYLTSDENGTILSILEDEEYNLEIHRDRSNLSILDEKCKEIWPEWQSSPVRKVPSRSYVPAEESRNIDNEMLPMISPRSASYPDREELARMDANSLKADVDALMSRIRGVTCVYSPSKYNSSSRDFQTSTTGSYERTTSDYSPLHRICESPRDRSMHVQFVHPTNDESISKEDLETLRSENLRLKAELLKIEKRLELETEENKKLVASLENSERIRSAYKQQLAQSPPHCSLQK